MESQDKFRDENYPDIPEDKIVLDFSDHASRCCLRMFARICEDQDLSKRIDQRIDAFDAEEEVVEKRRAQWRKYNKKYKPANAEKRKKKKGLEANVKKVKDNAD